MFKLRRGDVVVMSVLVVVGLLWLSLRYYNEKNQVYDPASLSAVIKVDGKLYETIPLNGEERSIEISTELGHNVLEVFDHGIQMVYADCPRKISMAMGFISRPNEVIVCVPNRIFVEIVQDKASESEDMIDAFVR